MSTRIFSIYLVGIDIERNPDLKERLASDTDEEVPEDEVESIDAGARITVKESFNSMSEIACASYEARKVHSKSEAFVQFTILTITLKG